MCLGGFVGLPRFQQGGLAELGLTEAGLTGSGVGSGVIDTLRAIGDYVSNLRQQQTVVMETSQTYQALETAIENTLAEANNLVDANTAVANSYMMASTAAEVAAQNAMDFGQQQGQNFQAGFMTALGNALRGRGNFLEGVANAFTNSVIDSFTSAITSSLFGEGGSLFSLGGASGGGSFFSSLFSLSSILEGE